MPRRKQDKPKRMKWEDGGTGKEKSDTDGQQGSSDSPDALEDGNSNSSKASSRSCTPEPSTILPQVIPGETAKAVEETAANSMDILSRSCLPMEIAGGFVPKSELKQDETGVAVAGDEEADDEEEENEPPISRGSVKDDAPLDFSLKKSAGEESTSETDDQRATPNGVSPTLSQDGPLDLSVPRRRHESPRQGKHLAKLEAALSIPSSPWGYNTPKHLSKNVPKHGNVGIWNGKVKQERREKSPGGLSKSPHSRSSAAYQPLLHKNVNTSLEGKGLVETRKHEVKADPYRPTGRQNPWQSQWMSRSSEQTKDVFTCVWCKESFRSLADMTVHMKQSPRCGMAGMQTTVPATSPTSSVCTQPSTPLPSPISSSKCSTSSASASAASNAIKENVSLPRKLVRGQDVWLGKGAEQTRQILKCMWCGQSFKTLADMTTHMRVTQHYTNIISQEQIISWRTPEDKMAAQSQVNAVLTCKVCDQAFGSLKELSYHMVKNSHYKEHILRSITEGGGRRRQTRERRKKSLPVRKLLELERMELNKQTVSNANDITQQPKNEVVDGKISCEECTEKVDAKDFVQHIKNCAQGSRSQDVKSSPGLDGSKSTAKESSLDAPTTSVVPSSSSPQPRDSKTPDTKSTSHALPQDDSICDNAESACTSSSSSTSVLTAIERLIEKSFETKGRRNAVSTGILQRLGIDEEVYPPWHPSSSPNAFGGSFRGAVDLQRKSSSPLNRAHEFADYSGSESRSRSSSTSEKHPSFDEHLRLAFGLTAKDIMNRVSTPSSASQSCSPIHFRSESPTEDCNNVFVAKTQGVTSSVPTTSTHHLSNPTTPSPKRRRRSETPCSDRDANEIRPLEEDLIESSKNEESTLHKKTHDDAIHLETSVKMEPEESKPLDCSDRSIVKSEERATPVSRCSSVEPDSATPAPPPLRSSTPLAKSVPKKRRAPMSEGHHHNNKSSKRRTTRSPKRKNSDRISEHGGDSVVGSPVSTNSADFSSQKHGDAAGDHPLKELQKLLDKTDAHLSRPSLPATPGSILAFSWACSEATASDSLMKCAFCDTHFISKGAYRHHLSKMHFVKEGSLAEIAAATTWKPQHQSVALKSSNGTSANKSPGGGNSDNIAPTSSTSSKEQQQQHASSTSVEESPHSKFQKYTELAKQLSSKYV